MLHFPAAGTKSSSSPNTPVSTMANTSGPRRKRSSKSVRAIEANSSPRSSCNSRTFHRGACISARSNGLSRPGSKASARSLLWLSEPTEFVRFPARSLIIILRGYGKPGRLRRRRIKSAYVTQVADAVSGLFGLCVRSTTPGIRPTGAARRARYPWRGGSRQRAGDRGGHAPVLPWRQRRGRGRRHVPWPRLSTSSRTSAWAVKRPF